MLIILSTDYLNQTRPCHELKRFGRYRRKKILKNGCLLVGWSCSTVFGYNNCFEIFLKSYGKYLLLLEDFEEENMIFVERSIYCLELFMRRLVALIRHHGAKMISK